MAGLPSDHVTGPPSSAVDALSRVADELVRLLPSGRPAGYNRLPWGVDAGSDHSGYRYWVRDADGRSVAQRAPDAATNVAGPLISVVVPVYRPELWYFRSCIESVLAQTYSNWELCLCDDASGDPGLSEYMAQMARQDGRIKVTALEQNGGISRATNAALSLASGEFVALLDHDDLLTPDALAEVAAAASTHADLDVLYSDDDKVAADDTPYQPHFKSDWSPDLLLSYPYLGHLLVVRRTLLGEIEGFRPEFDGSQDYDVMLRATELARCVVHVPRVLYHWRAIAGSAAADREAKPWAHVASRRALEDAVRRRHLDAVVEDGPFPGAYHVRRRVVGTPTVSVIMPFRDGASITARCLQSLEDEFGHETLDIVLVDNGSVEPETQAFVERLGDQVRLIEQAGPFNWSAINNLAAATCNSDLLLFMNNDMEARRPGWLKALVEQAQRPEVGAVGARLVFPDGVVQHAGVVLGQFGIAGHIFQGLPAGDIGYAAWDRLVRPYSAVTGACMMSRREVFEEIGGFDEDLQVAFNDIDYCMRLADAGLLVLYTPHAELVHYESVSRGMSGFFHDYRYFLRKWDRRRLHDDRYYNPNLSLFAQWCPIRGADEEERWQNLIDGLMGLDDVGEGSPITEPSRSEVQE